MLQMTSILAKEVHMDYLTKIKAWAKGLTEVGVSLLALGIVLEVLFMGQPIPFWPNLNIIGNVQNLSLIHI